MSSIRIPPNTGRPISSNVGHLPPRRAPRTSTDFLFWLLCQCAALLVIVIAALLVVMLIWRSWLAIKTVGVSFLTQERWDPVEEHAVFGSRAFVFGTLATSAIAMLIAVPLGIGTAAYLSEIATGRLRRIASFFIEMLAAVPSVVYGFWGIYVLAPLLQNYVFTPLCGINIAGKGLLTAGLILSIMIVPYIAAITFDVCQAVPRSQREGSLALGSTVWQTIRLVVLPYARPGIIGGCFLALGRALGETMAVTMLIGNTPKISFSLCAQGDSIASVIANQYMEASYDLYTSVLVELGLLLLIVTVVINSLARLLLWWVASPKRKAMPAGVAAAGSLVIGLAIGLLPALLVQFGSHLSSDAQGSPLAATNSTPTSTFIACFVLALILLGEHIFRSTSATGNMVTPISFGISFGLAIGTGAVLSNILTGQAANPETAAMLQPSVSLTCLLLALLTFQAGGRFVAAFLSAHTINRLMTMALSLCVVVVMGMLIVILAYLVRKGITSINPAFFLNMPQEGGMKNALVGSLIIVGLATFFAVPIGLLIAIALAEYRGNPLSASVRFIAELLGGVPSIITGIFAATLFGYFSDLIFEITNMRLKFHGWAGVFALATMMLPIVIRASEEALKLVPHTLRNASFALGSSHAQTVIRVTIPAALPAIITGIFLAIARISGETAPLLLTVGFNNYWPKSMHDWIPTLPVYIFELSRHPSPDEQRLAWAAAFVLMTVVLLLNFGIRFVTGRRLISASRAD